MQREINSVDVDKIILFQLFNTPGTEIAPGSDKIGIDIEGNCFRHIVSVISLNWVEIVLAQKVIFSYSRYFPAGRLSWVVIDDFARLAY